MEPVKLEELMPEEADVVLNGKKYSLRKVNLKDEVWLIEKFGRERVSKMIAGQELQMACSLLFRVLKDKTDFLPIEEDAHDDDGKPCKVMVTSPERIMKVVIGTEGKQSVMEAIYRVLGISNPKPDPEVKSDPKQ